MRSFRGRRGQLINKGVTILLFFFLVPFLAGILALTTLSMKDGLYTGGVANSSVPSVVLDYGLNGTQNMARQLPTVGNLAGIAFIILLLVFAIGGFLIGRNNQGGGQEFGGGGFGG